MASSQGLDTTGEEMLGRAIARVLAAPREPRYAQMREYRLRAGAGSLRSNAATEGQVLSSATRA
jgi:hypothetical protein